MDNSQARLKQRVMCTRNYDPNFLFPSETKGKILRIENIDQNLGIFYGSDKRYHNLSNYEPCYSERRIRIENRRTES